MGLKVNNSGGTGQMVTVREKIWLNADRTQLVPDGHAEAAYLFATPDMQIPVEDAERYGLVDGRLKGGKPKANKMADPASNKGAEVVDPGTPFDPSAHNAAEVIAYLETAEKHEALRVLDAEAADDGKKRSTVLAKRDEVEARVQGDVSGLQNP